MIWIPVAFCLVAVLGSLGYAGFRGYRLWRTSKAVSKCATHLIAGVSASAARVEERAVGLSAKSERLAVASAGLRRSLDELAAILHAAAEPQALLRTLRGAVPRK